MISFRVKNANDITIASTSDNTNNPAYNSVYQY